MRRPTGNRAVARACSAARPARRLAAMATRNIPVAEAGPRAADVMLREPRAVPPDTTVQAARETFANPRVRLLLVADGDRFLGAVTRADIGDGVDAATPLGQVAADA